MNKKRKAIYDKSGGHCWYCGIKLGEKGWHIDHVDPVYRFDGVMEKPENDTIDNSVPACAPCNLFKATFTIEEFRREVSLQIQRARRGSVNFRTAERFGLIKVVHKPVTFWFEDNLK